METFSKALSINNLLLTRQNHFTLRYNFPGLYKALKVLDLNVLFLLFVQSVVRFVCPGASRRRRSESSFFRASVCYEQTKK